MNGEEEEEEDSLVEEEAMGPPPAGRVSKAWTGFPRTAPHEVRGLPLGTLSLNQQSGWDFVPGGRGKMLQFLCRARSVLAEGGWRETPTLTPVPVFHRSPRNTPGSLPREWALQSQG